MAVINTRVAASLTWIFAATTVSAQSSVTFNRDIAPIVYANCASCHRTGGAAPFPLVDYASVRARASLIAEVTRRRLMPPWLAEPGYGGPFIDQHPLDEADIERIQQWVAEGAVEGAAADQPPPPPSSRSGWQLGTPDLTVTLPRPYELRPGGADMLRVFVIPLPVPSRRFVRGLEVRSGDARVVHHINIRVDRTRRSRQLDAADPAPGYEGLMANSAQYPDGHFLGWTPGQVAPLLPPGLAWRLEPGTDLVVEMHLQPSGKPETVQPSFGLFFTDVAPTQTPTMLRLGRQDIDIAPGDSGYQLTDSFTLPVDVEVAAVQPHAHYRAKEIRGFAELPDGTTRWLLLVKAWDFRWQHVYRYATPIALPRGSVLTMSYVYDNSSDNPRNPFDPPRRASWGQRSSDEMGNLWVQVLARTAGDRKTLEDSFQPVALEDDARGYEMMIEREPANVALRNDLALLCLELGRPREAVTHFEAARALAPSAAAHFNVGVALMAADEAHRALESFERALQLNPAYVPARLNAGNALLTLGNPTAAREQFREVLRQQPANAVALNSLGLALLRLGKKTEALARFEESIRRDPSYGDPHFNIGRSLSDHVGASSAEAHLRRAIALNPESAAALGELAWLLAAGAPESERRPHEAITLADTAVALSHRRDATLLGVLAVSYEQAGRADDAHHTAIESLAVLAGSPVALPEPLRSRLDRIVQ